MRFFMDIWHNLRYGRWYSSERFCKHYDEFKSSCYDGGALAAALLPIIRPRGVCIELGAGTGFLTRILAGECEMVYAYDRAQAMINFARNRFAEERIGNVEFGISDHLTIPLPPKSADLIVAGWTFMNIAPDYRDDGFSIAVADAVRRISAWLKPGGRFAVVETASMFNELPRGEIFHPKRKALLESLEHDHGFTPAFVDSRWAFDSNRQKRKVLRFWGGGKLVRLGMKNGEPIVHECIAVYVKQY